MKQSTQGRKKLATLWMSQSGECLLCKQPLEIGDLHIHHLIERCKGGKEVVSNEVLLHDTCHKQVHSREIKLVKPGSVPDPFEKLEPYAGKLARTVLRGRGSRNGALLPD